MSFAGHSEYTLRNLQSWNKERRKFSARAVAKIGTTRGINWTSKANTISESSNQDIQIRQMSQSKQMKGSNDELDQIADKKQSNIKRGHTTFPL